MARDDKEMQTWPTNRSNSPTRRQAGDLMGDSQPVPAPVVVPR
jgi:hypothetical protein